MDTTRPSLLLRIRDPADAEAWKTFDGVYRPMLCRFARARGLGAADAEDVAQHCLSAIASHIREFEYDPCRGRFKGWLRTLVNNHVRNLLRNRRPEAARTGDFERPQEREAAPEEVFERFWLEEHLRSALEWLRGQVDERTYAGFERYVIQQQPAEKVSGELELSVKNLYTIKWRLTQKIAERMRELTGEPE